MKTNLGFCLLELVVALAILTVITVLATANLGPYLSKQNVIADTHSIMRIVAKCRESSLYSGERRSVCGLNSLGECSGENIVAMLLFSDKNKNRKFDSGEISHLSFQLSGKNKVFLKASANSRSLTFNSNGYARQYGSFYICPADAEATYFQRISVNRPGRAYIAVDKNNDGKVEKADGSKLICANL